MHIRRQQQCLIDIPGPKILAHSSSLNQTRSKLNSDYSDRLLAGQIMIRSMWLFGTNWTNRVGLMMSVVRARPEVAGRGSKRRD
jgi:hypothetical protein